MKRAPRRHFQQLTAEALKPAPAERGKPGEQNVLVCVRQRHGKGSSCAGSGSLSLLTQMRNMLIAEDIAPAELSVMPVGCLGLCSRGPVMLTADARTAVRGNLKKLAKRRESGVHTKVKTSALRPVLREALARTWSPATTTDKDRKKH